MIQLKLDSMNDSVTGQTVIDPKGYMTDLTAMNITPNSEIADIKKARELMKSVITTNPRHGPGWIAAARVEERAGKLQVGGAAREGGGAESCVGGVGAAGRVQGMQANKLQVGEVTWDVGHVGGRGEWVLIGGQGVQLPG